MSEKEGAKASKAPEKGNTKGQKQAAKAPPSPRPYKITAPLTFYWLKDILRQLANHRNFPDALLIALTIISIAIAFPSFPLVILIPLLIFAVVLTMLHPMLGLMAMLFETLPMIIYQVPLVGWLAAILVSIALFLGYKHYRTVTFIYALVMLPLSVLGGWFEIPAFILGVLFIGFRRASISAVAIILLVAIFSGLTGIQNSGPIVYNAGIVHTVLGKSAVVQYITPNRSAAYMGDFGSAFAMAGTAFFSYAVTSNIFNVFGLAISAITDQWAIIGLQILVWLITVFAISSYAVKSRSAYKGTVCSLFGFLIPVSYIVLSYFASTPINLYVVLSFVLTPLIYFFLEFNGINLVRTLEVVKQDFLGQFSDSIEELTGSKETLDDVANYTQTKEELKAAVLAPVEHREISGAYNVKPARGILLFGPPGTGKTLIMRALANEIRGRFYYVKTSSLVSPFQGESSNRLSRIFALAKKHAPAILFFDEIDGLASSRELKESDEARQLLSSLLAEMDGFEKISGVVIVGSTNAPNLLDASIMRPGRFDKIIYMSLPDEKGRVEIFKYYLKKLPVSKDIDLAKLAKLTNRYSGADIKNICDETARIVSEDAIKTNKVLQITMADMAHVIDQTKPSTSISQLEMYNTFKIDYERRMHPEMMESEEKHLSIDDVIGVEPAKKAIYEAIEIPILHPELIKKYDVANIKGILLFGPPGVGKTMLMRAVSQDIGTVRMLTLSGAEISKYGLERAVLTIKQTFDRARENAPSVIFIDEIDSLLPSREHTSELGIEITSSFLQEMDGIKDIGNIVVVGATNRPESLDPALLRGGRFDKLIFIQPPNDKDRTKIFEKNLSKAPLAKDVDFEKLGAMTSGYTGADIANICRQIKLNTMEKSLDSSNEEEIRMEDIVKQINDTRPSAPNVTMSNYLTFLSRYGRG